MNVENPGHFVVSLRDLTFYSCIGVMEQERTVGNEFTVDVSFKFSAARFRPEDLDSTISYADVYTVIADHMRREWQLLESVSKSISDELSRRWPEIESIRVRITKKCPPISGIQGSCSVEFTRE